MEQLSLKTLRGKGSIFKLGSQMEVFLPDLEDVYKPDLILEMSGGEQGAPKARDPKEHSGK